MSATHPNVEANKSGKTRMRVYLWTIGGVVIYVSALIITLAFSHPDTKQSGWASVLFAFPVVAQVIGAALFNAREDHKEGTKTNYFFRFSMFISFLGIAVYCLLWGLYVAGLKSYIVFSWAALVVIAILLGVIGVMMYAFMHPQDEEKAARLYGLRAGAANEPLWALTFLFLVIFLDVAFMFGFALAFHDQHCLAVSKQKVPALRMLPVDTPDDLGPTPGVDSTSQGGAQYKHEEVKGGGGANGRALAAADTAVTPQYYFYFESGQAHLDTSYPNSVEGVVKDKSDARQNDGKPVERADLMDYDYRAFNYCSIERMKKRIEEEASGGRRTRIVLIGRSDSQPISGKRGGRPNDELLHYKSNYELSEARVENVRYKLIEALKGQDDSNAWHNLEWLTLPSSDEDSDKIDGDLENILKAKNFSPEKANEIRDRNKRIVIASIAPISGDLASLQMTQMSRPQFKELSLIDYMYFSIYTITTTGYGDIIPTTAYSKFVISIANICEVLFLVVFFNALVSIKGDKKGVPGGKKEDSDDILGLKHS